MNSLRDLLIKHEGLRLKPYRDTMGKLSIGVGRCIQDIGISKDEAMVLLDADVFSAEQSAAKYEWFHELNEPRRAVIVSMIFNMGASKFAEFKQMHRFMAVHDYPAAANEALDSLWARQVKTRAIELTSMLKSGDWLAT